MIARISVNRMIVLLLLVFVFLISLHDLTTINQDIARHLKSGELIWQSKSVYKTNLFSFTEPDHIFINHHWLSEVIFFSLNKLIGLKALIILKALLISGAFFIALQSVWEISPKRYLLPVFLLGLAVFNRTSVRPEIFSYFIFSLFLWVIFQYKYQNRYKFLYFLPLLQILWTNFHIYFALGPGLIFLLLVDRFFHKKEDLKKISLIFILTGLATLINPNFIRGALAPFSILREYGYRIVENQSIFFLSNLGIFLSDITIFQISLVILAISILVALSRKAKGLTLEILILITFSILGIKMIRNFGLYSLALIPSLALVLKSTAIFENLKQKAVLKAVAVTSALILIGLAGTGHYWSLRQANKNFGLTIPIGAGAGVVFLENNQIEGNVFNNFDVGSFLIWKRYPEHKVFVDGRPEAYSVNFFEKIYKPMQEDPKIWDKLSEEYDINYIFFAHTDITPWAQKFLIDISKNKNWPLVYLDNSVAIFLKKTPGNQDLIDRYNTAN